MRGKGEDEGQGEGQNLAFTPVWVLLGGSSWMRVRGGGGWVKVNKLLLLKQFSYHLFGRGSEEAHRLG